ncbi:MAG: putative transposase [Gammaproteobacteria bacterium]|jgi:putative transposase
MRYKIFDQSGLNFLTMTVVDWLDVFTRKQYKDLIIESLKYCQAEKGLVIYAYVIMTNHIHLIAQVKEGHKLSDTIRDFKSYTGKALIKMIEGNNKESRREWLLRRFAYNAKQNKGKNRKYQFWKSDNHPIALFTPKVIWQKINYVHLNPVVEGIVSNREAYCYLSAQNYAREEGMLEVELMDFYDEIGYLGA